MFRNRLVLDVKGQGERLHRYECDYDCPLGEAYDALSIMKAYVLQQMNEKASEENKEEACESPEKCDKDSGECEKEEALAQ